MEITLSKYAGFCEGVQRAFDIVRKIAEDKEVKKPIYVLGSLVHNNDVVEKIASLGVRKLEPTEDLEKLLGEMKEQIGTLVITAHGMGPEVYKLAEKLGMDLVDTTCPRVTKVQRLAKVFLERESQIVIIGERNHKEVKGIYEWARRKAVFVETEEDLCGLVLDPDRKIAILSQTTQDQDFVERASKRIKEKYPHAQVTDSICLTTHHRQSEIKKLAQSNDAVVVIGSPESANSNRLWEIAKRENSKSYFVQRAGELRGEWFGGAEKVAVTAGASTPEWVIEEVLAKLRAAI